MLKRGFDLLHQSSSGHYPIHHAARGPLDTLKAIVAMGSPVDLKSCTGSTALHMAVNKRENAMYLLDYIFVDSLNDYGQSPLLIACLEGAYDVLQIMIDRGADVDRIDVNDHNALWYVANRGLVPNEKRLEAIEMLLRAGAKPVFRSPFPEIPQCYNQKTRDLMAQASWLRRQALLKCIE